MYSYIYDFFKTPSPNNKVLVSFDGDENISKIDFFEEYNLRNAWGMSMSLDCKGCNHTMITSEDRIREYTKQLCELINMNRWGDCMIHHFGKGKMEGYTMVQLIETSNITAHFSNDTNSAYIDIFSCKPYNPNIVKNFTKTFFECSEVDINVVLRK